MDISWIFDMDGVVLDSNPHHKTAWSAYLKKHGLPFSDHIFDHVISGKTGHDTLRQMMGSEISAEEVSRHLEEIDGNFQEIIREMDNLEALPGLKQFIRMVRSRENQTALATSAPPGNVEVVLEKLQLRGYFDRVADRTCVSRGKPHPEVYLRVMEQLGADKSGCIVFEDSMAGIQAALGAGLKVVGLTTSHSRQELLEFGAHMVIRDFTGVAPELFFPLFRESNLWS